MTLNEYMETLSFDETVKFRKKLAKCLGVSQAAITNWLNGNRNICPKKAIKIELFTKHQVSKKDLRPDVFY